MESIHQAVAALVGPAFYNLSWRNENLSPSPLDLPDETDPARTISSFITNYLWIYNAPISEFFDNWGVDFVLRVVHMMWVVDRVHPLYRNNVVGATIGSLILATKLYLDDMKYTTVPMLVKIINWKHIDAASIESLEIETFTALLRSGQPFACQTRYEANSIRSNLKPQKICTTGKTPAARRWSLPAFRQVRKSFSRVGKKDRKTLSRKL